MLRAVTLCLPLLTGPLFLAQQSAPVPTTTAAAEPAKAKTPSTEEKAESVRTPDLNLLGKVDAESGESRRNENVPFNLIDNNALKELNVRMGATATIVPEFRIDRGYFGAEFGNRPPDPLHLPASRAAGLHGDFFETHNNSVLSARSFFQVGSVKPAHENDYGLRLGIPLWRGARLSLDGSQQKIRGSVNGNILVPKQDERTPLATDPAVRAIVQRFLNAYPAQLPNRPDINQRALNTNSPQRIDGDRSAIRLDQTASDRDRISANWAYMAQQVTAFQLVAGQNPNTTTRAHSARLTWNRLWTPQTVTDFSAGFERARSLLVPEPNAVGPLVVTAFAIEQLGPDDIVPVDRVDNRFRYAAQIMHTAGHHLWTAGFEVMRRQLNGRQADAHRGIFFFENDFGRDTITNIRMGTASRYRAGIGNIHRGFRNWDMQYYAGDNWQARPNLSLNFGVRYSPVTAPTEVNHLSVIPYGCDCNNLAPRFGIAYRLPRQWGVLRSAYALDYGEIFPATYQQVRFNPPNNVTIVVPNPYLADPLRGVSIDFNGRTSVRLLDRNLVAPYSHQYNFSWERSLARPVSLQIGYVGSRSHKLLMLWYTNRAQNVPGIPLTSDTLNLRRLDPTHFDVYRVLNASAGYFDAARATLILREWRGLAVDMSYWFSKAIDLGSGYTNVAYDKDGRVSRSQSEFDVLQDMKGLSGFDQPHAFLLRLSYTTPAPAGAPGWLARSLERWNFSAVALRKTGTPFDVGTGSDAPGLGNVDGQSGDRPNLLDPSILGSTVGHPDTSSARLPRSAFAFIALGAQRGNLGHNVFRKGGIGNINASLSRNWRVGGDKNITLRAESINFFNTPQFAEPTHDLTSPSFGQINNTLNDGRMFRFTLRFGF